MNSINLIGNISNDIELKKTPNGKSVCAFNVAVKRPFTSETTDFIPVVCWDKQAENVSKYAFKGARIGVTGVLTTRKYQDKNGNNRTVYEVKADNVQFLTPRVASTNVSIDANGKDPLLDVQDKLAQFSEMSEDTDLPF